MQQKDSQARAQSTGQYNNHRYGTQQEHARQPFFPPIPTQNRHRQPPPLFPPFSPFRPTVFRLTSPRHPRTPLRPSHSTPSTPTEPGQNLSLAPYLEAARQLQQQHEHRQSHQPQQQQKRHTIGKGDKTGGGKKITPTHRNYHNNNTRTPCNQRKPGKHRQMPGQPNGMQGRKT